jgi:hypothetical protein
MPLIRVYLPLDDVGLAMLRNRREIGPAPLRAHAVATALEHGGLGADEEAMEYAALLAAAAQADAVRPGGGRRVVVAADVEPALVEEVADGDATQIEVDAPVPMRRIVSFHVDEVPGGVDDADLLWYDVTEVEEVIALAMGQG